MDTTRRHGSVSTLDTATVETTVAARRALELVLREVPTARIGVAGLGAAAVAEWLCAAGHEAEPVRRAGKRNGRERHVPRTSDTWDAIVAVECIERAADPGECLREIKQLLQPEGRLIAVLPNVTHASVRIAMLLGRYPRLTTGASESGHLLSVPEIERLMEDVGFTVVRVEREVDCVETLRVNGNGLPASVFDILAKDADAMTSHYVLLAEPQGLSGIGGLHRRLRELAEAQRASALDSSRLANRVDSLEARVPSSSDAPARVDARLRQLGAQYDELAEQARISAERLASIGDEKTSWDAALRQACESLTAGTTDLKSLIERMERARYQRLIPRIRRAVNREIRPGSIVAVLSRGDNELVAFDGCKGWHFPQTGSGVYAGHHPADGKAACAHLDEVRARGARYLLIPRTAFWWLDHYREFNDYLLRRCRCVLRDEHTCLLFDLGRGPLSR